MRLYQVGKSLGLILTVLAGTVAANDLPRTNDGHPDLSGVWDFRTLTPLQRPANQADKTTLSADEAQEIEARSRQATAANDEPSDANRGAPQAGTDVGTYNRFWVDSGAEVSEDLRTSLIVDPPNGRVPPLRDGVATQSMGGTDTTDLPVRFRVGGLGTDGPESRGIAERCLLGFNSGPPILPGGYNQNIRISQTSDHVVILNEMVHDARIVPLAGQPRLGLLTWMGESRGRWEDDTLVVETINFHEQLPSFSGTFFTAVGTAEKLVVTEQFRRIDADTLRYEFTVEDPATYDVPITAVMLMRKSDERLYEYACHEGNYAMRNMLAGARATERFEEAEAVQARN
jgi:hypothetical protein